MSVITSSSSPLGAPLPFDDHACSVSLPTWCSVVGYEEGEESVVSALKCGYPRFVFHPYVVQLMDLAVKLDDRIAEDERDKWDCIVLPNKQSAIRCREFMNKALGVDVKTAIRVSSASDVYAVVYPATTEAALEAKCYWQHTGEVVSSRRAEVALRELHAFDTSFTVTARHDARDVTDASQVTADLKTRIAGMVRVPDSNVFLTSSGMAAIYSSLRAAIRQKKAGGSGSGKAIVYGFPYLDTLKLCSRPEIVPDGVEFFGKGDVKDLESLKQFLQSSNKPICALITEFPSNPLLNCHDLLALRALATQHDFCLIVDDTISNFANIDLIHTGIADIVCTSLTKLFSGRGDAMAGSMIVNPHTAMGADLKEDLLIEHDDTLFPTDAKAILNNSDDFLDRSQQINETSHIIGDWLKHHPDVDTLYYPQYTQPHLYDPFMNKHNISKHKPGYAGLMSIILGSHICQRQFYDTLDLSKGPSLGTNFTLLCPYTLLAHYHELEFARAYGVSPYLIRISIGLESEHFIKHKFQKAFDSSRLYPKFNGMQKRHYTTSTTYTYNYSKTQSSHFRSFLSSSFKHHPIRVRFRNFSFRLVI